MTLVRPPSPDRFQPEHFFRPRSVAVIGAGTPAGALVLANLLGAGFSGPVLPVQPGVSAASGVLAYPDVEALPLAPDLAVIATPPDQVAPGLAALGRRGGFAAVVTGPAVDLDIAGVRVLGPGAFGLIVPSIGLNASRAHLQPPRGRLALVAQSASLCRAVLDWAGPNGVGFSHVVGLGEGTDLEFGLVLDWLSRDADTGLILLEIHRLPDRRGFLSAARACARLRPVLAMRAGGRLLDPAGRADLVFEAALRRAGVLCVSGFDDLLAAAETLARARPVRGEGLGIVTNAAAPGQLAADAVLRDELRLAELQPATRQALRAMLPDGAAAPGPVHVPPGSPIGLADAVAMLAGAEEVGGIVAVHAPAGAQDDAVIAALAAGAPALRVPLLVCAMGETTGALHRGALTRAGVPAFATPEQAATGFGYLHRAWRARLSARELPPRQMLTVAPDRDRTAHIFRQVREAGRQALAQDEAMAVLSAYGIATADCRKAATPEEAAAAAVQLGFPVVVKLRRAQPPEPGEIGGLALDLATAEEVARMAATLAEQRQHCTPEARFLVQKQVGRARELLIRAVDDPVFGPAIGFGQGGTAADLVNDIAWDLPPLNLPLARALIGRTRVAATLGAFRDQPAADERAVQEALVRVSQLLVDFPDIASIEINPLFADAAGVRVADAWIRLQAPGESSLLAIAPYPAELTEEFEADGERITIRPIRPEDAEAHGAFFHRLPPEDVRYRFFSPLRELTEEQMARMTQIDYTREMAFIAVRESSGDTVGVARLVREPASAEGEFAVIVQPDMKGRGVATRLMRRLIEWARAQGLSAITGQVLADNAPMLGFVRGLGFKLRRARNDVDVIEARLGLD